MNRPLIGISAFTEDVVRDGPERTTCSLVGSRYVGAVERCGGVALLLPARADADRAMAERVLDAVDGVVLVGGGDIAARRFGERDHPAIGRVDEARDCWELLLAEVAMERDVPLLGVCRGMQVMAVAAGGSVEQHLPDRLGHNDHATGEGGLHVHEVTTVAGTLAAHLLGPAFTASCHHHQGVGRHPGFVESAWSRDEVLEAMERPGGRFCVGVQSHPETIPDDRLFAALVRASGEVHDSDT